MGYKQVYSSNAKIDINKLIIHLTIYNIITHIDCNFEVSVSNIVRFGFGKRHSDTYSSLKAPTADHELLKILVDHFLLLTTAWAMLGKFLVCKN